MKLKLLFLLLVLIITSALVAGVSAATPGDYSIDWWTVDAGGGTSVGGGYSLGGSIGQPDGGTSTGGAFTLSGGFWSFGEIIFLYLFPLFFR